MVAVDTNILIYAHRKEYGEIHEDAVAALRPFVEGNGQWAIPYPCVYEFIAVVSHPKVFEKPTPVAEALDVLADFADSAGFHWLAESPGYLKTLRQIAEPAKVQGGKIHDARIAALCLHHGVRELWTRDRDFSWFPQIKTRNPLVKI
jgi:toxin-antitoxin system PIN domain toxin